MGARRGRALAPRHQGASPPYVGRGGRCASQARGAQVVTIEDAPTLKQDVVFRFKRFEVGLFAEHEPHLDLYSPRDR